MVYNLDNESERRIFKRLPEGEKLAALYEIMSHVRHETKEEKQAIMSEIANIKRAQIETKDDLDDFKKEQRKERENRKKREQKLIDLLDTSPEINKMSNEEKLTLTDEVRAIVAGRKRDDKWMPIVRDLIRITLAILAIIGGSKLLP